MAGLRKLLGDGIDGVRYIATQVGVGYAFVAPIERQGGTAPRRPEDSAKAVGTNLPARLPHLIGRERDVEFLVDRVADTSLFSIVGAAGVGKTSLAVEIGHRLAPMVSERRQLSLVLRPMRFRFILPYRIIWASPP